MIRELSRPLDARATSESPRLHDLPTIAAVVFDVYGTLVISGSGEVGTAGAADAPTAFREVLENERISTANLPPEVGLESTIRRMHEQSRARGVDYPEVDIREVWRDTLRACVDRNRLPAEALRRDTAEMALAYECRVNPVWPMPSAKPCLDALTGKRILGIVSNAQFFTPMLFPALLGKDLDQIGFARDMQYYSYECGVAKPSPRMFQLALDRLGSLGVPASETLYVGNDMLNDISTAQRLGMKTALFAGDARSLRWRDGDPRVAGVHPDLVITDLTQLTECIL